MDGTVATCLVNSHNSKHASTALCISYITRCFSFGIKNVSEKQRKKNPKKNNVVLAVKGTFTSNVSN